MISYESAEGSGVVEISAGGRITKADIDACFSRLEADLAKHGEGRGKIKVLERVGEIEGVEPAALWADVRRGLPQMGRISHAALVSDQSWIIAMTKIAAPFVPAQVRTFTQAELEHARAWLASV